MATATDNEIKAFPQIQLWYMRLLVFVTQDAP